MEVPMATSASPAWPARFELRFAAAGPGGHDYAFPCDERGQVDLDTLPERQRCDYFFARALVGRDVARPVVVHLGPGG
jgi:hypothetical protein